MASYMFTCNIRKRRKLPYLISLWSGYYMAALSVCAFALLNQWIDSSIEIFSALLLTSVVSLLLGNIAGRILSFTPLMIGRLVCLLGLAAALTLCPMLLGDAFATHVLQSRWSHNGATIIACALFGPSMTLLAAIPPYAASLLIRDRGSPGSVNSIIMIGTAVGFGIGSLATAHHLVHSLAIAEMMKTILLLSAILIVLTLILYPPRRICVR